MIPIATGVHWDMRRYMQLVVALSEGEWVTKETKRFRLQLVHLVISPYLIQTPLFSHNN
jgi:hypothetical protein